MSKSSFFKRRWKLLLNIATTVGLIILAIAIRKQLLLTIDNLTKVRFYALLLMIPLQIWNYDVQTRLTQKLFKVLGDDLDYKNLYKIQLELNFVNTVFPTNGVSGASYFAARVRNDEIRVGRASFVYVMKLAMTFFAFEVLLFLGLILLAIGGHVNNFVILAATFSTTVTLVSTLIFVYVIGSRSRVITTFSVLTRFVNRLIGIFRPHSPETIKLDRLQSFVSDFHENYRLLRAKDRELIVPLFYGFLNNLTEVLTIYVVYIAFGRWVNPGAIILAYAIANFAGFVSVLPSGVGVYEGLMTGVLVAAGIPARISLPVTIMYRVLNTIIQIPPGYYYYRKALNGKKELASDIKRA